MCQEKFINSFNHYNYMEDEENFNSVCMRCGRELPLNENGLCMECDDIEKSTGLRCIRCDRSMPVNAEGLCMDCEAQENANAEFEENQE